MKETAYKLAGAADAYEGCPHGHLRTARLHCHRPLVCNLYSKWSLEPKPSVIDDSSDPRPSMTAPETEDASF